MGKKTQKKRGSREHGRGRKAGRGAGLTGGRGNAGSFGHKFIKFYKEHGERYFGGHGFTRPQSVIEEAKTINVGDLWRELDALEAEGFVTYEDETPVIDLDAAGYDKLLGAGKVHRALKVKVPQHTDKAIEKVQAEGGSVEATAEDEDADEDEASDGDDDSPAGD